MSETIRRPAVAGMFYPGNRASLALAIDEYLAGAGEYESGGMGMVRAVVSPHAGYIYSGATAGYAFNALRSGLPDDEVTVFLMGPAHGAWFSGVSTGDFDGFATPLGIAPINKGRLRELWSSSPYYQPISAAHQNEHCLEVVVPFLQRTMPHFSLVPMLFRQIDPRRVGRDLAQWLRDDPNGRVVVSSDLSHFNDYETACLLDRQFLEHLLAGDIDAVLDDREGACGRDPLVALMQAAAELDWTPHLLHYCNSGDSAGDRRRVVGYAAVAYSSRE